MVERTISLHCHIAGPDVAKAMTRSIWLTVYG